jgi:hypothetical protein
MERTMTLMNRALILVAGWIGRGMTAWLSRARRPLAVEVAALRERLERIQAENDLLRSRLVRTLGRITGLGKDSRFSCIALGTGFRWRPSRGHL